MSEKSMLSARLGSGEYPAMPKSTLPFCSSMMVPSKSMGTISREQAQVVRRYTGPCPNQASQLGIAVLINGVELIGGEVRLVATVSFPPSTVVMAAFSSSSVMEA